MVKKTRKCGVDTQYILFPFRTRIGGSARAAKNEWLAVSSQTNQVSGNVKPAAARFRC
jgi:hypothetical protein